MNFTLWTIVSTLLSVCGSNLLEESKRSFPRVVTPLGTIEGYYKTSNNGRSYEAYEGIPYAEPPIGELRFEVAKSVSPWEGVLMAKRPGSLCMQYRWTGTEAADKVVGSEDCLFINIHTAIADDERSQANGTGRNLLPVIFFIHGGAFQKGNASSYGPKYLLDNNVTLVTFSYRVGALGFLSTEDEIVPGNMGLKDQVIALRWVKDNIESFGGDPSRVTLIGQSAGGVSAHYHYLTNLTTGLFQRGMSLSGTALDCWGQTESSLDKTKTVAGHVGCSTDNIPAMVNCLKARPAREIVSAVEEMLTWMNNPTVPFGPVVEKGGGEFTFIDRSPIDIINSGHAHDLPWITGVVSEEGLIAVSSFITQEQVLKEMEDKWETIAAELLEFRYTVPEIDHANVSRSIKQHYLGTSQFGQSTINQIVQMFGDRLFVHGAQEAARLQARANRSPVHYYYFSYRGAHSFTEIITGNETNFGVCHLDDIFYVFRRDYDPTTTPEDRKIQKTLIDLWVSFATNGTPNVGVEWSALNRSSTDEINYLHIARPDEIAMRTSRNIGENDFWHSIGLHENLSN